VHDDGSPASVRAAYLSVAPTPLVLDLSDVASDPRAAADAARQQVQPEADLHATADYRRHLAGVLTERALVHALGAARLTSMSAA
jgi:carbon-monoxide dehydrogenase medium subunit